MHGPNGANYGSERVFREIQADTKSSLRRKGG
jgi:hypothetical protein